MLFRLTDFSCFQREIYQRKYSHQIFSSPSMEFTWEGISQMRIVRVLCILHLLQFLPWNGHTEDIRPHRPFQRRLRIFLRPLMTSTQPYNVWT